MQVIQSVIVLFIAAPALIRAIFRLRESRGGGVTRGEGVERMTAPLGTDEELVVVRHVVDVRVPLRTRLISGGAIHGRADLHLRLGVRRPATPTSCCQRVRRGRAARHHDPRHGDVDRARPDRGRARGLARRARVLPAADAVGDRGVLVCFVVAFLCWASTGSPGNPLNVPGLLQNTILLATPLVLGALAGILCERTGVINVAIEGQFLAGAFAGALGASVSHSLGVGAGVGLVAGGLMGALLAVFAIRFR